MPSVCWATTPTAPPWRSTTPERGQGCRRFVVPSPWAPASAPGSFRNGKIFHGGNGMRRRGGAYLHRLSGSPLPLRPAGLLGAVRLRQRSEAVHRPRHCRADHPTASWPGSSRSMDGARGRPVGLYGGAGWGTRRPVQVCDMYIGYLAAGIGQRGEHSPAGGGGHRRRRQQRVPMSSCCSPLQRAGGAGDYPLPASDKTTRIVKAQLGNRRGHHRRCAAGHEVNWI